VRTNKWGLEDSLDFIGRALAVAAVLVCALITAVVILGFANYAAICASPWFWLITGPLDLAALGGCFYLAGLLVEFIRTETDWDISGKYKELLYKFGDED